jgi:hypothetical protein
MLTFSSSFAVQAMGDKVLAEAMIFFSVPLLQPFSNIVSRILP